MKLSTAATLSTLLSLAIAAPAFATPDLYVVNFRHAENTASQTLDGTLSGALEISTVNAEQVIIDTTTAAKWQKSAHDAFNRDIVPVFNKWVGLPGFIAVVDANSKNILGCIDSTRNAPQIARDLEAMASIANNEARLTRASTTEAGSPCPATFNQPPN